MSGTGRRRKPSIGEDGEAQQPSAEQSPNAQSGQYQTYQQPAQPQYDYDWRQSGAGLPQQQDQRQQQPGSPGQQPGFDPFQAHRSASAQPVVPPQPQYDQFEQYNSQQAGSGYQVPQTPQSPQVPPQQPRWEQPAAPTEAVPPSAVSPSAPAPAEPASTGLRRPRPRPEPVSAPADDFDFDFDLDDPKPAAASPGPEAARPAAPAAATSSRPVDKDGYRSGDFAFVDQADDPEVGGWLEFSESRADSRAERVRKLRTRLIAGGATLALVAAGVGAYLWLGRGGSGAGPAAQATKSMILFRLDDTKGDSVGDALLVTQRGGSTDGSAAGSGAIVVIPSQMQIDDEGFGEQPFGGDMSQNQPPAGIEQVSDALGVTPDGMWTIDETTFGIFVDELNGLTITTNTAVPPTAADPKGVPAGQSTLSGVQAVAYATYQAPGEPAAAQVARFGHVLEALFAKIPAYSVSVTAYLNQLGLIPDPTLPLAKLSPILAALAAQQAAGRMTTANLPLVTSGSNALNAAGASGIVTKLLGGTVKAGASAGQSARILVQDGTGASGVTDGKLIAEAQAELVDAGYTYNAGTSVGAQAHTEVEVASSADQSLAGQVAAALGLSGSAVHVVPGLSTVDDVTVVLGQDWSSLAAQ